MNEGKGKGEANVLQLEVTESSVVIGNNLVRAEFNTFGVPYDSLSQFIL